MTALRGPLGESAALFATGVRRTFVDKGKVLDLVPPAYLKPVDDEIAGMLELPERYPGLIRADVIGQSVEGRPLVALHMTNFDDARPKPTVGLMGGIHGDEIGNGPWGLAVLRDVLEGYGKDPAATAALNSREFRSIPFANPDGRARAELGYLTGRNEDLFFRTNARGVDLNRNFPFHHGATNARRGSAGPLPASEPETRAFVDYWEANLPRVFADVHSEGRKVLIPFGHTTDAPKDDAGLRLIAEGIGARNGYRAASSSRFTKGGTSGTSKDWMYGVHDVPSFTLEVGRTHHLTQKAFDYSVRHNRVAMSWFARVADAPYERASGPGVVSAVRDGSDAVRALVRPEGHRRPVAAVEAYVDPLAAPGSGVALLRRAGAGSGEDGATRWSLDRRGLASLDAGDGVVMLRAQDDAGTWGPFTAARPAD